MASYPSSAQPEQMGRSMASFDYQLLLPVGMTVRIDMGGHFPLEPVGLV